MGLKSTRMMLSIIFAVILSFSTVLTVVSIVLNSTVLKIDFYVKHAITDEIVTECEKQLSARYETLEAECGIPARVFNVNPSDTDLKSTLQRAVASVFSAEDARLYSADRIDRYYRFCTEYLEANDIAYSEDDVMRTAQKAAKIYSDTVGVQNDDEIQKYLNQHSKTANQINSVGLAGMVLSAVLIVLMYRKLKKSYQFVAAGLMGGGFAIIVSSLLCIITGVGKDFAIQPLSYQSSFASMVNVCFAYMLAIGVLIIGVVSVSVYYTQRDNKNRDESNLVILVKSLFKK